MIRAIGPQIESRRQKGKPDRPTVRTKCENLELVASRNQNTLAQ